MNGLYDALVIILVFPVVVYMGASGGVMSDGWVSKLCKFLGDISYPLYITHYAFIYWFTSWAVGNQDSLFGSFKGNLVLGLVSLAVLVVSILVAWASLKWYDEPVRKWLTKKWMPARK
jgi:peptidoglycan/LPS O-acetylase OafA/YrhL